MEDLLIGLFSQINMIMKIIFYKMSFIEKNNKIIKICLF